MAMDPAVRRAKNKEIKAFHQSTLDALGVPNAIVMSKCAYGTPEKKVSFFKSEINKGQDIYIEFGDHDLVPEKVEDYPLRSLFKFKNNPHYATEYESTADERYHVPIAELVLVKKPTGAGMVNGKVVSNISTTSIERESKVSEIENKTAPRDPFGQDPMMNEMTMRDYAAIHMRKPCSNKGWLNALIVEHNK